MFVLLRQPCTQMAASLSAAAAANTVSAASATAITGLLLCPTPCPPQAAGFGGGGQRQRVQAALRGADAQGPGDLGPAGGCWLGQPGVAGQCELLRSVQQVGAPSADRNCLVCTRQWAAQKRRLLGLTTNASLHTLFNTAGGDTGAVARRRQRRRQGRRRQQRERRQCHGRQRRRWQRQRAQLSLSSFRIAFQVQACKLI